jgi:hypothetical protein
MGKKVGIKTKKIARPRRAPLSKKKNLPVSVRGVGMLQRPPITKTYVVDCTP